MSTAERIFNLIKECPRETLDSALQAEIDVIKSNKKGFLYYIQNNIISLAGAFLDDENCFKSPSDTSLFLYKRRICTASNFESLHARILSELSCIVEIEYIEDELLITGLKQWYLEQCCLRREKSNKNQHKQT